MAKFENPCIRRWNFSTMYVIGGTVARLFTFTSTKLLTKFHNKSTWININCPRITKVLLKSTLQNRKHCKRSFFTMEYCMVNKSDITRMWLLTCLYSGDVGENCQLCSWQQIKMIRENTAVCIRSGNKVMTQFTEKSNPVKIIHGITVQILKATNLTNVYCTIKLFFFHGDSWKSYIFPVNKKWILTITDTIVVKL